MRRTHGDARSENSSSDSRLGEAHLPSHPSKRLHLSRTQADVYPVDGLFTI